MGRLKKGKLVKKALPKQLRRDQKYITLTFQVPANELQTPREVYDYEIDTWNTNKISELIKDSLEDINDRDNTLWRESGIELEDNFNCEYLDCEAVNITHYIVQEYWVPQFLLMYQKKGFLAK